MGLPEHMEGLDTFMQTAFNMTVDNWRMGNTVVLNYKSQDGTVPDFDANTYYGGEYVNAEVEAQPLGQDRTVNFDNMFQTIQKLAIPGTGINVDQISGDTSKTAFEFKQKIEANNKRSEMRLKMWEDGPLKRLGTLLLSASISELTVHDLENIREGDAAKVLVDIEKGRATRDDFVFKGGKPVQRKTRFYVDMKGMKENFTKKRTSRQLNADSTENTLVLDKKNPDAINKIPVTEEYVVPDWYVESGILFDTRVDSKRMITNKKIQDSQALQAVIQNVLTLAQVDPIFVSTVDFAKLFTELLLYADIDSETILKDQNATQTSDLLNKIAAAKQAVLNPQQNAQPAQGAPVPAMAGMPNPQQSNAQPSGQGLPTGPQQNSALGPL